MTNVIISPYSQKMRNGKQNPKNFPYWQRVVDLMNQQGYAVDQIGVGEEKKLDGIRNYYFDLRLPVLVERLRSGYDLIMSVDNFLPHFMNTLLIPVNFIVVFSKSDPNIFGYPQNTNVLKDRKYLRPDQFNIWEQCEYQEEAFISGEELFEIVKKTLTK